MMRAELRAALFRLGRELRYRPMPALVGKTVGASSVADVERALGALVAPWVPDAAFAGEERVELTLVKYGLVDVDFAAPAALLADAATLRGLPALRACGMLPKRGERWDAEEAEVGLACLSTLADGLGPAVLKLYLEDDLPERGRTWWIAAYEQTRRMPSLPEGYFPRTFTVLDACVTNAPGIWLAKHFYL
jgi:hypothetical protein